MIYLGGFVKFLNIYMKFIKGHISSYIVICDNYYACSYKSWVFSNKILNTSFKMGMGIPFSSFYFYKISQNFPVKFI